MWITMSTEIQNHYQLYKESEVILKKKERQRKKEKAFKVTKNGQTDERKKSNLQLNSQKLQRGRR